MILMWTFENHKKKRLYGQKNPTQKVLPKSFLSCGSKNQIVWSVPSIFKWSLYSAAVGSLLGYVTYVRSRRTESDIKIFIEELLDECSRAVSQPCHQVEALVKVWSFSFSLFFSENPGPAEHMGTVGIDPNQFMQEMQQFAFFKTQNL